ncbi:MAG: septum formation initiator family protein [Pseudomonadota bacterium]
MRILCLLLAGLLIALQLELWFGDVGLRRQAELESLAQQKTQQLALLAERNASLRADVLRLKANDAALEARARYDLGMIKEDEVFYFVPGAVSGAGAVRPETAR